jgi:hypothetical protein
MPKQLMFILLFVLSFSLLHDSFLSLMGQKSQIQSHQSSSFQLKTTTDVNTLHHCFHFMAIIEDPRPLSVGFDKAPIVPNILVAIPSPLEENTYKPPIV